jgi:hypothetical protein
MGLPDFSTGLPFEEVKASVSKLLLLLGYSVESSGPSDGGFMYVALRPEPLGVVRTLVYVHSCRGASSARIKRLLESAAGFKASKVVLVSSFGLSQAASAFAVKHGVEFIDGLRLESMLLEYGIAPAVRGKVFEFAFDLGVTLPEARSYFERRRGRRFLVFGVEESVVEVSGRYAPVGSFLLSRDDEVKTGFFKTAKTVSKSNFFYVNLNTCNLYYTRGSLGKNPSLGSSDVLRRVALLPAKSLHLLSDILKNDETPLGELNRRHGLFYEENMGYFRVLLEEGLVAPAPGGEGVMPNIALPAFDSPKYDLKKFTPVVKSVSSTFEVDGLAYAPKDVLRLLESFYAGRGEMREIMYMPYYTCVYADERGMKRSDVLFAPKYAAHS